MKYGHSAEVTVPIVTRKMKVAAVHILTPLTTGWARKGYIGGIIRVYLKWWDGGVRGEWWVHRGSGPLSSPLELSLCLYLA